MPEVETPLDVLVIATHPDDAEIGVGGTLLAVRGPAFAWGFSI